MSEQELDAKSVVEKINRTFEEFKAKDAEREDEIRKFGEATAATTTQLEAINAKLTDLESLQNEFAVKMNRPNAGGADDEQNEYVQKHSDAFEKMMRDPGNPELRHDLKQAEREAIAQKAVTIGTDSAGGYAVPEEISRQIHEKLLDISPMRRYARVVTASTSDYKELVDTLGDGFGWVGEGDTRSETDTSTLAEVAPTFGTIYAYPKASEESLNDIFFNVEEWLVNSSVKRFAKGEGIAFITGNGTKKPTGFLNGTPAATGDEESPARAFGTLEYVATGDATGFGTFSNTSPLFYPADTFISTMYKLKAGYRARAAWMMNKATLSQVRKFKDDDGDYIWRPGIEMGQPSTLLGYPIAEAEDMPDVGADAFPVAFGDFQEGYLIVDLVGLRITIDDNITTPGQVKFYLRKRVGGKLLNDDAIKVIKCAAS